VDYCNAVLAGSPKSTTDTLQRVLNAAARLVTNTDKYDRGLSSLLRDQLHWLNVPERIEYNKLAVMIRRCLEDKAPTYLSDYCIPAIGLSLLQARWSGTHYRLSFAICLSVMAFFGALQVIRRYSRDISAPSAIEMYP